MAGKNVARRLTRFKRVSSDRGRGFVLQHSSSRWTQRHHGQRTKTLRAFSEQFFQSVIFYKQDDADDCDSAGDPAVTHQGSVIFQHTLVQKRYFTVRDIREGVLKRI